MDNVFVTGANGLLGTNLVLMLLERGFCVVALVRRKGSFVNPEFENLHLLEGDLLSTDKLNLGICGCRYVVHVAANTSQNLLSVEDYCDAK
jgi:nucleoside-diphosphate-sugar epimerase